jgi:hypothetical protein
MISETVNLTLFVSTLQSRIGVGAGAASKNLFEPEPHFEKNIENQHYCIKEKKKT